jgi:hypothetical protein
MEKFITSYFFPLKNCPCLPIEQRMGRGRSDSSKTRDFSHHFRACFIIPVARRLLPEVDASHNSTVSGEHFSINNLFLRGKW